MNSAFRTTFVKRILPLSLLGLLLVVAMSCDGKGGCAASEKTARMIKEETGLDLNSPGDVVKAGVGGQTQGNKDEESTLDTVEAKLKAAMHEAQGDYLVSKAGNHAEARKEYNEAIRWTKTDSDWGKDRKASLLGSIALTYRYQGWRWQQAAKKVRNPDEQAELLKAGNNALEKSAQYFEDAAETTTSKTERGKYLEGAAISREDITNDIKDVSG